MNAYNHINIKGWVQLFDDFVTGSTETGEIGALHWSFTNGSVAWVNAVGNEIGVLRRTSGATANQVAPFFTTDNTARNIFTYRSFKEFEIAIKGVVADTDAIYRVGLMDNLANNPPANGMYFEKLNTDSTWFLVVRRSSTQSRFNTGLTFDITNWRRLRFVRNTNGSIDYFNGEILLGNIPSDEINLLTLAQGLTFGIQIIPTTTTARSLDIDNFKINLIK